MTNGGSILGHAVPRLEDPALLTGDAKYVDDLHIPGVVHVVFVRSSVAHGRVCSVDVANAQRMPGVLGVFHGLGDDLGLAPFQGTPLVPGVFDRPVFASDRVRFVGDIVAAVVAEDRALAVDAAECVVVDIDPLPATVCPSAALDGHAPQLFSDAGSNACYETNFRCDADPFEGADVVVELSMVSQRLAAAPMEPNGCLMVPGEPTGGLTCWISHQLPHSLHTVLAATAGLDPSAVRIVCPFVGGGFGPKASMYVEYLVAAVVAKHLGRPVKWIETRSENMLSLVHGRDTIMTGRLGLKSDGEMVGLDVSVFASAGAYPALGAVLPMLTQLMAVGTYNIPRVRFHAKTAVTNTTPVGAYRGAGRPEATQLIERLADLAAVTLNMDPAEVRRRNFFDSAAFPLTTATGAQYDSGAYATALDTVLAAAGYRELRSEQELRRGINASVQLGIGISTYVEVTAPLGLHVEYGAVEVHADDTVSIEVGTSSHGQGHHTAFAMVASEVLGVPMDRIRFVQSDTSAVPRGSGTAGSRSLQTAGNAVHVASNEVLARAKQIAAHFLEASPEDVVVASGGLAVAGVPSRNVSWSELAAASDDPTRLPGFMTASPLRYEHDFDGTGSTFPFGAHVAVVELDTDTGRIRLLRHIAVDDCGRIINPLLVAGQQHGGIAQGVAQALFEWVQYDQNGNPLTTNFLDYAIPSAAEFPSFEVSNTETPSPLNPLGAKGIGESGTIGSTPAVHNAVVDALSHFGVRHVDMPCTPERVWRAIQEATPHTGH